MSLNTYNDMVKAIAFRLDRNDLAAEMGNFITLAESRLNRELADNVNLVVRGNYTFSSQSITVPDDFNGMVSLLYDTTEGGGLRCKTADDFFNYPAQTGIPRYYTISAGQISIWPTPADDPITLTMRYRTKLDALNLGPNWLLENHPDAYLYGALVEAGDFIGPKEERTGGWLARFNDTMAAINKQGRDIAYGGPLQVKSTGGE